MESTEIRVGNGIQGEVGLLTNSWVLTEPNKNHNKTYPIQTNHHQPMSRCLIQILKINTTDQSCQPLEQEGALKLMTYSGKTQVFIWVLHIIYFLGFEILSTPESNSSELGRYCSEPTGTSSAFPSIKRQSKICRMPSSSGLKPSTLHENFNTQLINKGSTRSWMGWIRPWRILTKQI